MTDGTRRHPVAVLAVALAAVLAAAVLAPRFSAAPSFLVLMAATYWVGRHASARAAVPGLIAAVLVVGVAHVLSSPGGGSHASAITFFAVMLVIAPATAGLIVRARARLAGQVRQAASRLRDARESRISAAVTSERQRIAADLDGVMLRGLDGLRRHAAAADRGEVAELERTARETLAQMRGLLARFRGGHGDGPVVAGHPGDGEAAIPSLPELRARVMAALADTPPAPAQAPAALRLTVPSRRPVDATLALLAAAMVGLIAATRAWPADALTGIAVAAPLAVSRRFPVPVAVVSLAATIGYSITARPADPTAGVPAVAMMVLIPLIAGAACGTNAALGILGACLAAIPVAAVADPAAPFSPASVAGSLVLALASWSAGRLIHGGGRMLAALAQATARARDEEEAGARQAVVEERLRVARELHDAVGHAMTAIVMQATAARRAWEADPDLAAGHVAALRDTTSQAVEDLHALVVSGAVTLEGVPADTTGVASLRALAGQARRRGLPVRLDVTGPEAPLSPAASQAAYRIVQEAITNAARHAPGAQVEVTARFDGGRLALEVTNQPPDWPPLPAVGTGGHGLPGMRERATACGGTIEAGFRPDGCFTVLAHLPCEPASEVVS